MKYFSCVEESDTIETSGCMEQNGISRKSETV